MNPGGLGAGHQLSRRFCATRVDLIGACRLIGPSSYLWAAVRGNSRARRQEFANFEQDLPAIGIRRIANGGSRCRTSEAVTFTAIPRAGKMRVQSDEDVAALAACRERQDRLLVPTDDLGELPYRRLDASTRGSVTQASAREENGRRWPMRSRTPIASATRAHTKYLARNLAEGRRCGPTSVSRSERNCTCVPPSAYSALFYRISNARSRGLLIGHVLSISATSSRFRLIGHPTLGGAARPWQASVLHLSVARSTSESMLTRSGLSAPLFRKWQRGVVRRPWRARQDGYGLDQVTT